MPNRIMIIKNQNSEFVIKTEDEALKAELVFLWFAASPGMTSDPDCIGITKPRGAKASV